MKTMYLSDNWKMHRKGSSDYVPAKVPGSVYSCLLDAGRMENPFWKDNEIEALRLMDDDYEFETTFTVDGDFLEADKVNLKFNGIDTIADIYLNGEYLAYVNNMHRTWEYSVKDKLSEGENSLKVSFHSPTKYIAKAYSEAPTRGTEDAMDGFVHIRKAHCMFGWDWGAHLPDMGIWREVVLNAVDTAELKNLEILQYHENGKVKLCFNPEIEYAKPCEIFCEYTLEDPEGNRVCAEAEHVVEEPKLWWPNGFGKQNLYSVTCVIKTSEGRILDSITKRIGLRTMEIDRSKDKWGEKFATRVNGVNIFAMGADYIPEDHILSRVTKDTTERLLKKAVFANFNSIRVWGGGYYPSDWFYDLCDEMGLIVWQDFMFACGVYDLTPEFEENITAEFEDNIKRLRHHASLGLMCGNNEMESFVASRTWVSKDSEIRDYIIMYERILPMMMKKLAPQVFYWPASPSSGGSFDNPQDENRGDVHYWDVWHGSKPFTEYRKFHFRYLSEFGFQSFPSKKTVETFTDDEKDMNIFSYIMERHQRNGAANGKIMNYMQQTYRYPATFEKVIYASQLLQADAIKYGVEHFRRNRNEDRCMGAVYWQFNDCWPVASWSSVDYEGRLKALHYYARRFFAPIMISCEEAGYVGSGCELVRLPFEFEKSIRLCVSNETLFDENIEVKWQLRDNKAGVIYEESRELCVPALTSIWLDKHEFDDMDIYSDYVSFQALKDGEVISEGTVLFSVPKYFRFVNPGLKAVADGKYITVYADSYAKCVEIQNDNDDLVLSDNFFDMNAGRRVLEVLSGDTQSLRLRSVYDIG